MLNFQSTDPVAQSEDHGQVVPIHNPQTGQPLLGDKGEPFTVTVAGTYSKIYRKAFAASQQRARAWFRQHRGRKSLDQDVSEEIEFELVTSSVLAWSEMGWDGAAAPCTKENVLKLLKAYPWIFDQIKEAMDDHENFPRNGSPS